MNDEKAREALVLRKAHLVKETVAERLMADPNVTGVGVGYKVVNGKRTDEVSLRIYVRKKLPKQLLRPEEILPESVDGILTDVIEADFEIHSGGSEHRSRHYPLVGGISIGNLILGGSEPLVYLSSIMRAERTWSSATGMSFVDV